MCADRVLVDNLQRMRWWRTYGPTSSGDTGAGVRDRGTDDGDIRDAWAWLGGHPTLEMAGAG